MTNFGDGELPDMPDLPNRSNMLQLLETAPKLNLSRSRSPNDAGCVTITFTGPYGSNWYVGLSLSPPVFPYKEQ